MSKSKQPTNDPPLFSILAERYPTHSAKAAALADHRLVFPEPLARQWVDEELDALEAQFLRTLQESGYTEDDLRSRRMLQDFIADASRTPRARINRVAEAMVGLELLYALRGQLASPAPSPERVVRSR